MLDYPLLAPIAILLLGAILVLITLLAKPIKPPLGGLLALSAAGGSFLASLPLVGRSPSSLSLPLWHPSAPLEAGLAYRTDDLAFPYLLLMTFVGTAAILSSLNRLSRPPRGQAELYAAILVLMTGGLSLVLSANLITLYVSWGVLDLSTLLLIGLCHRSDDESAFGPSGSTEPSGRGPSGRGLAEVLRPRADSSESAAHAATRAFVISQLAGLALLAAALLLDHKEGGISLQAAPLPVTALSLMTLAALVRAGLYPAHIWLPMEINSSSLAATLLHVIPISAGTYLLARLYALAGGNLPRGDLLTLIGSVTLVAGAVMAWGETNQRRALSYVAINQVGYMLLPLVAGTEQATIAALWQGINLALCFSILFLSQDMPASVWIKALRLLAVASLAGLPPTMGFVGRWVLYRHPLQWGYWPPIILSAVTTAIVLAPLIEMLRSPTSKPEGGSNAAGLVALGLLAFPFLLLGPQSLLWMSLTGPIKGSAWHLFLDQLVASVNQRLGLQIISAILLPLISGYLAYRLRRLVAEVSDWGGLGALLDLEWLYRLLYRGVLRVGRAVRSVMDVIEGERYLGWVVLLGFVLVVILGE